MHDWDKLSEPEFDEVLADSLPATPPDIVVEEVTPWRAAIDRVLIGMALNAITLNFLYLNYLLPFIGSVMCLLGWRALRRENHWFTFCWLASIYKMASLMFNLALKATVYSTTLPAPLDYTLGVIGWVFFVGQILGLWQGMRAVRKKAGLAPGCTSGALLLLWYILIVLLAISDYSGLFLGIPLVVGYVLIIRALYKLSAELAEAGYAIQAAPVNIPDHRMKSGLTLVTVLSIFLGGLLFSSYSMDWQEVDITQSNQIAEIREELLELGFPDYVLDDLTDEDILACDGALRLTSWSTLNHITDEHLYPNQTQSDDYELEITGVAVELPGERETWKFFHHFRFVEDVTFFGTESILLWPAYSIGEGWSALGGESYRTGAGIATGQILYDQNGVTYAAPFHNVTSGGVNPFDVTLDFSFPNRGQNQRGYASYVCQEVNDGYIMSSWINYVHQQGWWQYPLVTDVQSKRGYSFYSVYSVFNEVQDALQFDIEEDELDLWADDIDQ